MTQKLFSRISQFGFGGLKYNNTQQEHKKKHSTLLFRYLDNSSFKISKRQKKLQLSRLDT